MRPPASEDQSSSSCDACCFRASATTEVVTADVVLETKMSDARVEDFRLFMKMKFHEVQTALDVEYARVFQDMRPASFPASPPESLAVRGYDHDEVAIPKQVVPNMGDIGSRDTVDIDDVSEPKLKASEEIASIPFAPINTGSTSLRSKPGERPGLPQQLSRMGTGKVCLDDAPECAFVINTRRFITIRQVLTLLHELLKNTAIAAITLVAAGTKEQFITTLVFIASVLTLYTMHEMDWDRLDVEDIQMLYPLVVDDFDPSHADVDNPNRIFKAVTVTTRRIVYYFGISIRIALFFIAVLGWIVLEVYWRVASEGADDSDSNTYTQQIQEDFRKHIVDSTIKNDEDAMAMAMQLTVGCLMYTLQILFEYIHWRETVAIMPPTKDGRIWDPRRHGVPPKFWLFGMPSMWFTSTYAYTKLKRYIAMVNLGTENVFRIYPQELAYYSLSGDDCRNELTQALGEAKNFDPLMQSLILGDDGLPDSLEIDLCFYDSKLKHSKFPYVGEFQYFKMNEGDDIDAKPCKSTRTSHMVVEREKVYAARTHSGFS